MIELIREHAEAGQWHYVNTKENPEDYVSRNQYAQQRQS